MDNNSLQPFSILLIEDEDKIRKQLVEILKFDFEDIYAASSAEMAMNIYKDKQPNIMLIDINLPNISGLDFLEKIRKTDQNTKAIMLTAHSDVEYLMKATSLKLTDYLIKPYDRKSLYKALQKAVDEIKKFKTILIDTVELKDNYTWKYQTRTLLFKDKGISLSSYENAFLEYMVSNINKDVSYEDIHNYIYNYDIYSQDAIFTIVKRIRKKTTKGLIKTCFNFGYKIESIS